MKNKKIIKKPTKTLKTSKTKVSQKPTKISKTSKTKEAVTIDKSPINNIKSKEDSKNISLSDSFTTELRVNTVSLTDEKFAEILSKIIKTYKKIKTNSGKIPNKKFLKLFANYDINDEMSNKIFNSLKDNNITIIPEDDGVDLTNIDDFKLEISNAAKKIGEIQGKKYIGSKESVSDGIKVFLSSLSSSRLLTQKEENELAKLYATGDEEQKQHVINQLVTSNLRLVIANAKRYLNSGLELDDLIQEGVAGLIKAIEKFDYKLNLKFSTYATWWVKQAITRALGENSRMIRIPIHMIEISKQVDAASSTLNQKLGRMPTNIEVANFLGGEKAGYTPKKISAIKKINSNIASIDNQTTTDENSDFSTFIPEDNIENPNQFATREETTEKINQSLATYLTRDEETIIRMRYGLPPFTENYSFDVVALKLDKTREAIRQIEVKALKKLRHHFQADKMQELLSSEKE